MGKQIEIDVDGGIPAEVDEDKYLADPEGEVARIRAARAAATDLTDLHEPFPLDYDELVALFGEEG